MRLKQLVVSLSLLLCCTVAFAAVPQLASVSVAAQGNSTTVTLQANGPFRHNEYRTNDRLLLVDMTGLSAGQLHERERALQVPGVESYRIVGYKGMGGVDVARVELRVSPGAISSVKETESGLAVVVSPAAGTGVKPVAHEPASVAASQKAPAATPAPAAQKAPAVSPAKVPASAVTGAARVQRVSVLRGKDGMEVEITGSQPLSAKPMKLAGPDRIVLDVDNAVPAGRPRPIPVNAGDVKSVRISRYQAVPPVTRIVVDLVSAKDFELATNGNKLVLKLKPEPGQVASAQAEPANTPEPAKTPAPTPVKASSAPAPKPVQSDSKPAVAAANPPQPQPAAVPEVKKETEKAAGPLATGTESASAAAPANQAGQPGKGDSEQAKPVQPVVLVQPNMQAKADEPVKTASVQQPSSSEAQAPSVPAPQPQAAPAPKSEAPVNFAQEQRQGKGDEVVQKPRYTGEPISVNLKDVDLKDFFRLIHEISGLNVVLDPSVNGTVTLVLDDVPWDQALEIVLKNNSLDKSLDGNVLRIATIESFRKEAQEHRLQVEAQALAVEKINVTRFLSYAHSKDVLPTVKKLLSSRGDVVSDERTNALIIQDIPSVIPEVDRLLAQLDRKTQEVEIEARVVAATRTFARDIGTQLGFGTGSSVWAVGGVRAVGDSPIIANNPTRPQYFLNEDNQVPLFTNLKPTSPTSGISFSNATNAYRIDLVLAMAESRGLLKVLSRPRVVTQNNIQAIVKQGFRIPVVTLGQLGGPPSVTYIEAVLRLTVTPQITVENTIFLNVDIENTAPDFSRQVLGNPVFITQQATTQVLVTDGGTVLIGGVIQTNNSVNVDQVPLLGSVPVLGNLFKRRSVQNSTQELIFILTPKIVHT